MSPLSLDEFVKQSPELAMDILRFPSLKLGQLADNFEELVFWPRNRVIHFANIGHSEEEAKRCLSIAGFGLDILTALDAAKCLTLPIYP